MERTLSFQLRPRLRCLFLYALWAGAFSTSLFSSESLALTKLLLDRTVSPGSTVTFEIEYAPTNTPNVSVHWQHDGEPIPHATNSTLILTDVHAVNIGTYAVTVRDATVQLADSAVLDLDVPYPEPTIRTIEQIGHDPTFSPYNHFAVGAFTNGTIVVHASGGTYIPTGGGTGIFYWQFRYGAFAGESGTKVWTSPLFDGGGGSQEKLSLIAPNNRLINLFNDDGRSGVLTSLDAFGTTNWTTTIPTANFVDLLNGPDGAILPAARAPYNQPSSTLTPVAMVVSQQGSVLFSKSLPLSFYTGGRHFFGYPKSTNLIQALGFTPRSTNSLIAGAFATSGAVEWVKEYDLHSESDYLMPPVVGMFESPGRSLAYLVSSGELLVVKVLRTGQIAWTSDQVSTPAQISRTGHAISMSNLQFADVDRAGTLRVKTGFSSAGFSGRNFTFESPGNYRLVGEITANASIGGVALNNPSNRFCVVHFSIPEPDPNTPPKAEFLKTMNAGESVTLNASPDLPGAVVYQWFLNGETLAGKKEHDLTISNFSYADAGQYSVKVRTAYGAATNKIATLTYTGPPALGVARLVDPTKLLVTWPTSSSGFRVQQTADLKTPFAEVAGTIATNQTLGRYELTVSAPATRNFFRLTK